MLKFMVVLYRRPDIAEMEFHRFLREVHGPMALAIPGLRRYVQNHVVADPVRRHPGWDAIVELYFDDRDAMEASWATPQGQRATADVGEFADLSRSTWSVVSEEETTVSSIRSGSGAQDS
jgi:uncharacterized protein (TIGR02118 family)